MHRKFYCPQISTNIGKYNFDVNNYILPVIPPQINKLEDENSNNSDGLLKKLKIKKPTDFETFKIKPNFVKPSLCLWSFMSKKEMKEIMEARKCSALYKIIANKLKQENILLKGNARRLLTDLILSVTIFCKRQSFDLEQSGAFLSMVYNTHLNFTHNLWSSSDEIYKCFKEYIYFHTISSPPRKLKIFEIPEAEQIILYFCTVYLRNLPLIRMLMLPNYGLLLKIKNPVTDIPQMPQKKDDKQNKKKKT